MTVHADVVIVGAGVAGLSLAAALAPSREVVILEAEAQIARHSSGRSARQMQPSYGPAHIRELTRRSIDLIRGMEAEDGVEILSPRALGWVARESGLDALEGRLADNPTLRRLDSREIAEALPLADPEIYRAAAVDEFAFEVAVERLLDAYLRRALRGGAELFTGARVDGIVFRSGLWEARTASGDYAAPVLVDAAGAWADRIASLAGVAPRGILSYRRTVVVTEPIEGRELGAAPMISDVEGDFYARPEAGGLLLSPSDEEPVEPSDAPVDPAVVDELLARAAERLACEVPPVSRSWAGLRCFSRQAVPISGWDPLAPGFAWLAGQGGYGLQTSAALAEDTARAIVEGAARSSTEREA